MTLKEAQALLRAWGKFWRSKKYGTGYSSTSITYQMMQTGLLGHAGKSTKHLFSHFSESIYVPDWVELVDYVVDNLTLEEKVQIKNVYINMQYKCGVSTVILQHAEIKIASLL